MSLSAALARGSAARRAALLVLIVLAASELAVRALVSRDASGQRSFLGHPLRPYVMPVDEIAALIEQQAAASTALYRPDPRLGWAPRPGAASADGSVQVDAAALRGATAARPESPPGRLRIAIFGDSFTFGDEVALPDTWGEQLRRALAASGIEADVLNFGVNGYGVDQAYLRWQDEGRAFRPDLVILGFQPEDLLRNLNVFRPYYFPATSVPYSKPRFLLEGGVLTPVNRPALAPAEVVQVLRDPARAPLLELDRFFDERWRPRWWQASTLLSVIASLSSPPGEESWRATLGDDGRALGLALLDAFDRDVRAHGARFLALHLPRRSDLEAIRDGRPTWYADVLAELETRAWFVRPELGPVAPLAGEGAAEGDGEAAREGAGERTGEGERERADARAATRRIDGELAAELASGFQPGGHYGPVLQRRIAGNARPRVASELCRGVDPARRPAACPR